MSSNGQPTCCVNCGETLSTIVDKEKGTLIWKIPIDTHHNNSQEQQQSSTATIRVQTVLSSIFRLNYLDKLKSFVSKNTLLLPTLGLDHYPEPEKEVGVCQPCFDVLCNLFRFYDQFQQLRKIDSDLSNKIHMLDDLILRLPSIANRLGNSTTFKNEKESDCEENNDDYMEHQNDVCDLMECEFEGPDDPLKLSTSISSSQSIQSKEAIISNPTVRICRLEENKITTALSRTNRNRSLKAEISHDNESCSEEEEDSGDDFVIKGENVDSSSCDDDASEQEEEIDKSSQSSSSSKRKSPKVKATTTQKRTRTRNKRPPKILLNGTCPICQDSFQLASTLTAHLLTHMPDKSIFTCPVPECLVIMQKRCSLVGHIKRNHTLDLLAPCPVCQKQFTKRCTRKVHMQIHAEQNIHICDLCDEQFGTEALLETHKSTSHLKKTERYCPSCPQQTFETDTKLNAHMKEVHPGEKLLACVHCSTFFALITDVQRHMLRNHQEVFKCPGNCGRIFTSKEKLRKHQDSNTCDGQQVYVCSFCAKSFKGKKVFSIHEKIHTGEAQQYKCTFDGCDKFFYHTSALNYHLQTHSGIKAYCCQYCGMSFMSSKTMRSHLTIHLQQKRHLCQVCGKSFLRHTGLTKHSRVHSDERTHQCQFCRKEFKYPDSLRLHVRTYHQVTPAFTCEICEAGFPYKFMLQKHLTTTHAQ